MFDSEGLWKWCAVFYLVAFLCVFSYLRMVFTDNTVRRTFVAKGGEQRAGICRRCDIVKRKDMEHCRDCGTCCELFDHHCDMLNVCVTGRNFKYFFIFFFYFGM